MLFSKNENQNHYYSMIYNSDNSDNNCDNNKQEAFYHSQLFFDYSNAIVNDDVSNENIPQTSQTKIVQSEFFCQANTIQSDHSTMLVFKNFLKNS